MDSSMKFKVLRRSCRMDTKSHAGKRDINELEERESLGEKQGGPLSHSVDKLVLEKRRLEIPEGREENVRSQVCKAQNSRIH